MVNLLLIYLLHLFAAYLIIRLLDSDYGWDDGIYSIIHYSVVESTILMKDAVPLERLRCIWGFYTNSVRMITLTKSHPMSTMIIVELEVGLQIKSNNVITTSSQLFIFLKGCAIQSSSLS